MYLKYMHLFLRWLHIMRRRNQMLRVNSFLPKLLITACSSSQAILLNSCYNSLDDLQFHRLNKSTNVLESRTHFTMIYFLRNWNCHRLSAFVNIPEAVGRRVTVYRPKVTTKYYITIYMLCQNAKSFLTLFLLRD